MPTALSGWAAVIFTSFFYTDACSSARIVIKHNLGLDTKHAIQNHFLERTTSYNYNNYKILFYLLNKIFSMGNHECYMWWSVWTMYSNKPINQYKYI